MDRGGEFRVVGGFRAAQSAISDVKIECRVGSHESKDRHGILNRVRGESEHVEAAAGHITRRPESAASE